jgi:hypothetical protein
LERLAPAVGHDPAVITRSGQVFVDHENPRDASRLEPPFTLSGGFGTLADTVIALLVAEAR